MSLLNVTELGKAYRVYRSELRRVLSWFGFPVSPIEEHWVLRDISFSISQGEAIGIVGQNGAGKSSLLKLITGTQRPTEGSISINGRIAAILELGMGFNPEFSGCQNARHGLGLMGYSHPEIEKLMPELEEFADVGEYFDQPVRTYSSGMQMRVAFAVVIAVRPEILIIDEALSVGDAAFQRKCYRRIEQYVNDGMALLLVSHDIESIKKSCSSVLFLENGKAKGYGEAKKMCDAYEQYLFGSNERSLEDGLNMGVEEVNSDIDLEILNVNDLSYGDGRATIEKVWLENDSGSRVNVIEVGDTFHLKYRVSFYSSVNHPVFAFLIKTMEGISLYGCDSSASLEKQTRVYESGNVVDVTFSLDNHLSPGTYFVNCGVRDNDGESVVFLHRRVDVLMFKVKKNTDINQVGLVDLDAKFSYSEVPETIVSK